MLRRTVLLLLLPLVACTESNESLLTYGAGSVRWGSSCDVPFDARPSPRFSPSEEPCLEIILEGYYTRGDLTAHYLLGGEEIGRSRIEFTTIQALGQRMTRGRAESRVTFQLHHAQQPLPPSEAYEVVLRRAGTEVARYPFAVSAQ